MLYPPKNDHYATSELCSFRPKSVKLRYARSASLQPVPCPLSLRKRTFAVHQHMSAVGQERTFHHSLDHLVGTLLKTKRHVEAERLSGVKINH